MGATSWAALLPDLIAAWSGAPPGDWPDAESHRLAEQPADHRRAFLELSRRELGGFPFDRIHPRWVARVLPADPCLQHWAMQLAPAPLQATLARSFPDQTRPDRGRSWIEPTGPPSWFEGWWIATLRAAIPWPDELPWRRNDPFPIARLSRLDEAPLLAALDRIGTRGTAAAVHTMPPQDLVATLFALDEPVRERVVVQVRERAFPPESWWPQRWAALSGSSVPERVRHLGLTEVAAIARATARLDDARRLAWHLPPELGEVLLGELGRAEALGEPAEQRLARLEGDLA